MYKRQGHGCEMNGKNYLLPIDDELIEKEQGIENSVIHTEQILCQWSQQFPSSIIIFILDCCRLPYSYRRGKTPNNSRECKCAMSLLHIICV